MATAKEIVSRLKKLGDPKYRDGAGGFGITIHEKRLGVRIPELRKMAKEIGKDHKLAQELWKTVYDEARMLASMIDDPRLITEKQIPHTAAHQKGIVVGAVQASQYLQDIG